MSIFYCAAHQREEDSDEVGFVDCNDGTAVCQEAQDQAEWDDMTLAQKREAMGGEYGGDGPDD